MLNWAPFQLRDEKPRSKVRFPSHRFGPLQPPVENRKGGAPYHFEKVIAPDLVSNFNGGGVAFQLHNLVHNLREQEVHGGNNLPTGKGE